MKKKYYAKKSEKNESNATRLEHIIWPLHFFFQFIMTSNNQQTVQTRQGDKIVNYSSGEGKKSAAQVIVNGDWKCEMEF